MTPDVGHYLRSMRKAVSEILLPQVEGQAFAAEQARLIIATLGLLLDVQEHQYPYAYAECEDYQQTLGHLSSLLDAVNQDNSEAQELAGRLRSRIEEERDVLAAGLPHYQWLARANASKRELLSETIQWMGKSAPADLWEAGRKLIDAHVRRQIDMELSWMRLTGFDPGASSRPPIGEHLFGGQMTLKHSA